MKAFVSHPSDELMRYCVNLAKTNLEKGQYAQASIVVNEAGEIISESSSILNKSFDPTAHPEIVAIRQAADSIKSRYLLGYYLYTTLEPCPMCTSAAIWAKMKGIVFGAYQKDVIDYSKKHPSNVFTWRQITIPAQQIVNHGTPQLNIYGGVLQKECNELFSLCF